jgi:alpha,alpha-trehalase
VQSSRIFADSKTFPDCAPKMDPLDILIRYRKIKRKPDFDLRLFVQAHFWMPETYGANTFPTRKTPQRASTSSGRC